MNHKVKIPWETKDAMRQVYKMKLWGDNATDFYSGEGSHKANIVNPYINAVKEFLTSFKKPISVCDLGCGDFNIGKQLIKNTKNYIAVDIVADLIQHNKNSFKADNLEFRCLDIAKDTLPKGDCAIIRQVLQHLSNAEVQKIVSKLSSFKFIILTEHLPKGSFKANKDIISGQGIRLKKQSGINILKPPFNFKVSTKKELLSVKLDDNKGIITTTLYCV